MFKVGSRLFTAAGPQLVREIVGRGEKVFLDLKYHDIPNTVAEAVAQASLLGIAPTTVHALAGKAMMEAAVGALPAMGSRMLAVTILTSHDEASLGEIGLDGRPLAESVRRLARLAREARADGVVASPLEAELGVRLRARLPDRDPGHPPRRGPRGRPGPRGHARRGHQGRASDLVVAGRSRRRPIPQRRRPPSSGRWSRPSRSSRMFCNAADRRASSQPRTAAKAARRSTRRRRPRRRVERRRPGPSAAIPASRARAKLLALARQTGCPRRARFVTHPLSRQRSSERRAPRVRAKTLTPSGRSAARTCTGSWAPRSIRAT